MIDACEIANRNNLFTPVSLKRLPFLANSDFHKPKHIYSWKTLLHCEKHAAAIKECIRVNEQVSITLYRDEQQYPDVGPVEVAPPQPQQTENVVLGPLVAARLIVEDCELEPGKSINLLRSPA